jgi:hypothetical protein
MSRDMGAEEVNRQLHNMSLGLADSPTEPPAPDRFVKNEDDPATEKVVQTMAGLDNWAAGAAGLSVVPADIKDACATAVKEFDSLVFPDRNYQGCHVLERRFRRREGKTDEGVAPWRVHVRIIELVSLGAVAELKPLARTIPIDGFRAMTQISIQAMEDISSAKSGGMQFNLDLTSASNDFDRSPRPHSRMTITAWSFCRQRFIETLRD